MKVVICASINFTSKIKEVAEKLRTMRHEVIIPKTSEMILNGEVTLNQITAEKEKGGFVDRVIRQDSIKNYYDKITNADAILVLNYEKKGIPNYIGGNVLMEIGFAHVLGKQIFLLNPIPNIEYYKSEIAAMQPIIINGDLRKLEEKDAQQKTQI